VIRNLDLLRAVAVLCVLADHLIGSVMVLQHRGLDVARRMETIGHLGVLLFFVHTAFVLLRSLERTEVRGLVLKFWIRRVFRIYPLCWVCLLSILIFKVPQFAGLPSKTWDWRVVLSNALLIQNLTHQPNVIDPLWSLPREVQMYVALPFIFLLLQRFSSTITVLVLWLVSIELIPVMPFFAYFPCFMGGVLAYQLSRERTVQVPSPAFVGGLVLLIAGYTAVCWSAASLYYDFDFVLCMAVGALIPNVRDMRPSLVSRGSEIVARYSYGVYLWHVPVIWFSFVVLHHLPAAVEWMVFVGVMGALPVVTYGLIEAPMIRVGQRLATLSAVQFDRLWPTDADLMVGSEPSAD
jgi:peptidoglycan/LPS O-acetylase OafA/YrhL